MSRNSACRPVIGISERLELAEGKRFEKLLTESHRLGIAHLRLVAPESEFGLADAVRRTMERLPGETDVVLALPAGKAQWVPQAGGLFSRRPCFLERTLSATLSSSEVDRLTEWADTAAGAGWSPVVNVRADMLVKSLRRLAKANLLGQLAAVVCDASDAIATRSIGRAKEWLESESPATELWLAGTRFAPGEERGRKGLTRFAESLGACVGRVYWEPLIDEGDFQDVRPGLVDVEGNRTLAARIWENEGVAGLTDLARRSRPQPTQTREATLVTGGAGFIGANLADRLVREGRSVVIFDNLSRPGTESNLRWLQDRHGARVRFVLGDVRDRRALRIAMQGVESVFHLAAQVAVTTSMDSPLRDHEINTGGTLNLLELLRESAEPPPLIFTSTNKVYGGLEDVPLEKADGRYEPLDAAICAHGIAESRPLRFCSPYGCSKGASDQYVLDYAETFGLPATVFRMSCIYGPRQFGNEDQGWVAHFVRQALREEPITIYGDGCQVRDILFIDDLVEALLSASEKIDKVRGTAFNIGGGPANAVSLLQLTASIAGTLGREPALQFGPWRASDQRYYVSDVRRAAQLLDWTPRRSIDFGIAELIHWLAHYHGITIEQAAGRMA